MRSWRQESWRSGGRRTPGGGFLTAVLKSASFPPYDPWFAGGYINYYYYGFVLVATLILGLMRPRPVAPAAATGIILPTSAW